MKIKLSMPASKISPSTEGLHTGLSGETYADDCEIFKEVVASFKAKFPMWDLSHMHLIVSPTPRNHDGDPKTNEADKVKYTGSWTKLDTIVINSDMSKAIKFYGIADQADDKVLYKQAIAHELAHEIWKYQATHEFKRMFIQKAQDLTFDTPYLHHIDDDDPTEELFCEYMAYRVTGIWIKI